MSVLIGPTRVVASIGPGTVKSRVILTIKGHDRRSHPPSVSDTITAEKLPLDFPQRFARRQLGRSPGGNGTRRHDDDGYENRDH